MCTNSPQVACPPPVSSQVSWWETHVFVAALVAQHDTLPMAGTPAWCSLADGDPRKLLALAAAGEHHVLRMETAQTARADASHEISAAANWTSQARRIARGRGPAYIPRKKETHQ